MVEGGGSPTIRIGCRCWPAQILKRISHQWSAAEKEDAIVPSNLPATKLKYHAAIKHNILQTVSRVQSRTAYIGKTHRTVCAAPYQPIKFHLHIFQVWGRNLVTIRKNLLFCLKSKSTYSCSLFQICGLLWQKSSVYREKFLEKALRGPVTFKKKKRFHPSETADVFR